LAEGQQLQQRYVQQHERNAAYTRTGIRLLAEPFKPGVHFQMALVYKDQQNAPRMIGELFRTLELQPANADARRLYDAAVQQRQTAAGR